MSSLTLNKEVPKVGSSGNTLFPVFLKLENFHTLLVGGGNVGLEKLEALLGNSPEAEITVVADYISQQVEELASKHPRVTLHRRKFEDQDLEGISLAVLATNDVKLHHYIHELSVERGLLLNVADTPDLCDMYLGSIVKKGNLKIAISTNGKSPTMAKRLKEVIQNGIPEEIDDSLTNLNKIRESLNGDFAYKVKQLNALTLGLVSPKSNLFHRRLRYILWIATFLFVSILFGVLWNQEPDFKSFIIDIPVGFYYFLAAGFTFALIDGAIGMSYGVTSTTFSLSMGIPPASASMAVHISEILSNGIAGWLHYRLKNVNVKLFKSLVIPGIVGAVIGAALLSSLEGYAHYIRPLISIYTFILGFVILNKALKISLIKAKGKRLTRVVPLGFGGGFVDAVGGGGWGSIVLSTLIAGGRNARYALGSVKLSRFFIALFSSLTFLTLLEEIHWHSMSGLVIGSTLAAPIAVRLSHRISVKILMVAVGVIVVCVSFYTIFRSFY
jgi:siroheme synthase-like protein